MGILVLQNMYDSLPDLLQTGAGIADILFFYALSLPAYFPAILPITFLVSLLFSLGGLHRNNEIVAMRAAGVSLFRVSRSLWLVGLILSALLFYLTASLIPSSVEQARTFFDNLEYSSQDTLAGGRDSSVIANLGFDNRKDGRLWYMNRFSERSWLGMGVEVHTRTAQGVETHRISAKEAYFDDTQGNWVFVDGNEQIIDPDTGDTLRIRPFTEEVFDGFDEDPSLMLALHKKPNELSLFELSRIIETVPPEENPAVNAYLVRYYSLLAAPFSCLVVVGLAVPFAVSGVRTNPMIGISKCLGYFAVFYLLLSVASLLGDQRIIEPAIAAWIPNIVMLLLAINLFRKAR